MGRLGRAEPSFSVVALVREEVAVIRRFCDHHLRLGAEEILLYFDGAAPEVRAALAPGEPGPYARVSLTEVTPADWDRRLTGLEGHIYDRQEHVYREGHARCRSGWLFVADADEFILPRRPVPEMLDDLPAEVESVALPVAEAVWGPGDAFGAPFASTHFRRPFRNRTVWRVQKRVLYGRLHTLFHNNCLGHAAGKHFLRRDVRVDRIGAHASARDGRGITRRLAGLGRGPVNELLHFDAVSLERWLEKARRRREEPALQVSAEPIRRRQFAAAGALCEPGSGRVVDRAAAERLFRGLYGTDPLRRAWQTAQGTMFRADPFGPG